MTSKHSFIPWEVREGIFIQNRETTIATTGGMNWAVSRKTAEANAAFIVKACNLHEELVEALEEAEHTFVNIDPAKLSINGRNKRTASLAIIRAVLPKAKEEPC